MVSKSHGLKVVAWLEAVIRQTGLDHLTIVQDSSNTETPALDLGI
jgi:hypothetical protein